MKSKLLFIFLSLVCINIVAANPHEIMPKDAINIVNYYEEIKKEQKLSSQNTDWKTNVKVNKISLFDKAILYVVQHELGGYYIISSIDQAKPILVYSESGIFAEEIPDGMKDLLYEYEAEIAYIRDNMADAPIHPEWQAYLNNERQELANSNEVVLSRMADVSWNQSYNNDDSCTPAYNFLCPTWYTPSCDHTYAGCGAVAMAQVMWYYQWPYAAAVPNSINKLGVPSNAVHTQIYNWNRMPLGLLDDTPTEDALEVQTLLRDCGYTAHTFYKNSSSISSLLYIKQGLEMHFRYDGITHHYKATTSDWETKLKNEIDAGRPIIYEGHNPNDLTSGHFFVVFGYNSANNTFQINWGYGTTLKNWCTLGALIPSETTHNYSSDQRALFGIAPNVLCTNYIKTTMPDDQTVFTSGGTYDMSMNITSSQSLVCFSGTEIRLHSGFHACAGSDVHLGIRDFPCGSNSNASMSQDNELEVSSSPSRIQQKKLLDSTTFSVSPNPATNSITISGLSEDATYSIYNLTGEKVRETAETTIDISAFPAGMYVVIATTDGKTYQSKFIKE